MFWFFKLSGIPSSNTSWKPFFTAALAKSSGPSLLSWASYTRGSAAGAQPSSSRTASAARRAEPSRTRPPAGEAPSPASAHPLPGSQVRDLCSLLAGPAPHPAEALQAAARDPLGARALCSFARLSRSSRSPAVQRGLREVGFDSVARFWGGANLWCRSEGRLKKCRLPVSPF